MRRQRTKQCEAWRRRREQYLRESGRPVELIKEGYASADSTNWTVIVGGRARSFGSGSRDKTVPGERERVHGELLKSCGDWSLVQPSTVPPPPV